MNKKKVYLSLRDIKNIMPILNKISIFGGLSEEQLHSVFKQLRKASYRPDEYVFRQGDEPSYVYIIRSGRVKIVLESEEGQLEIAEFGVGECFGETSIIGIQSHSASAVSVNDTELIVLSREALFSFFDSDKELFATLVLNIAREACRRLHKSDEILLHYVHRK